MEIYKPHTGCMRGKIYKNIQGHALVFVYAGKQFKICFGTFGLNNTKISGNLQVGQIFALVYGGRN